MTNQAKVVVITGANSGIGKATALSMAKSGAHTVMVCRNKLKGEMAMKDIIAQSGNPNIDLLFCDFSVQQQIRRLVEEIKYRFDRIDVLINNAGLLTDQHTLTQDGIELTFAVNHLGYFMLTNLLLKMLKDTPHSRIINVSSEAHRYIKMDFDNLQGEKGFKKWGAYGMSKLANIMFTYELARRLKGRSTTTVNCLHPGVVRTNFGKEAGWMLNKAINFAGRFFLTAEQGAQTSIYLATSDEVSETSGQYFIKKKAKKSSKHSYDKKRMQKLWTVSAKLTRLNV